MVGTFAVLRRRALMGDALAHAALPGVCLAFLLLGERHTAGLLAGAFVTGVLGVTIVTGLRFGTRIKEDAAIGIVLSVFYGAGIALTRYIQNQASRGSQAGLESYILGKTSSIIESDVYLIAAAATLCLLVVLVLFKEFQVVAFDPDFAHTQGWPAFLLDLLLMIMIAVTVVIGLPAVGVVLIAAMLIIPAAAARFWTNRLGVMLAFAGVLGAVTGAGGTLLSSRYDWSAGPSIVLVGAGLFVVSMLFGPRRGVLRQLYAEWHYRRRVAERSLLRRIYECIEPRLPDDPAFRTDELTGVPANVSANASSDVPVENSAAFRRARTSGWIAPVAQNRWKLTQAGVCAAAEVVLAERMLELYLSDYVGHIGELPATDQHSLAEQIPAELHAELKRRLQEEGRHP